MTSKKRMTNRLVANAIFAATSNGEDYDAAILRMQSESMLNRDLTRSERNMVRSWFDMDREVSETEQCA